jgi:hypothetical protein
MMHRPGYCDECGQKVPKNHRLSGVDEHGQRFLVHLGKCALRRHRRIMAEKEAAQR